MKRLPLLSRFEETGRELAHYSQLLAVLLFIQRLYTGRFSLLSAVLLALIYFLRVRSRHWPAVLLLLFLCTFSIPFAQPGHVISGRVVKVQETYVIVQTKGPRILVYTDQPLTGPGWFHIFWTPFAAPRHYIRLGYYKQQECTTGAV